MDIGGNFTLGGLRAPRDLVGPSLGGSVGGLEQLQGFFTRLLPKTEGQVPVLPQPRFGEANPQPQGNPLNEFLGGAPGFCGTADVRNRNEKPFDLNIQSPFGTPPDVSQGGPGPCGTADVRNRNEKPFDLNIQSPFGTTPDGSQGGPVVCTTPNFQPATPDGSQGGPVVCTTPNFQPATPDGSQGGPVVCTTPNFQPAAPDGSQGGPVVCTTPNFQPKQG